MTHANYDIFKRDAFGARIWVEATRDLDAAKRRVMELSANSPGKYLVLSRASGQMVGGGTTITSTNGGASNSERNAQERKQENASGTGSSRKVSSHAVPSPSDTESETLWR